MRFPCGLNCPFSGGFESVFAVKNAKFRYCGLRVFFVGLKKYVRGEIF